MPQETLKQVLMERDELTDEQAQEMINEMVEQVKAGEDPAEILYEIGLELDYVMDLLFACRAEVI